MLGQCFVFIKSLGYVNACHQSIYSSKTETVITYYYNFSESDPKTERESIYSKDENYWKEFIVNDLKIAHPKIEEMITEIEINILGHGMISPSKTSEANLPGKFSKPVSITIFAIQISVGFLYSSKPFIEVLSQLNNY